MAIRTWVGRFCVADGRVEEEGPWLSSLVRQRPDEEPDELYVVVEPASGNSEEYTRPLVDVVTRLYNRDPLSLTGALTRSLRAAHEHLREWNRRALAEHRAGAGASCIALRGAEAYLAQVGPSLAYVRTADGDVRRVHAEQEDFAHALGVAPDFEPRLHRLSLRPGDLVLVASTQLDAVAPPDHIERVLARGADDALPELYLLGRDRPNLALLLLSCLEEEPAEVPEFLSRDAAQQDHGTREAPAVETAAIDDARTPEAASAARAADTAPAMARASAVVAADAPAPARPAHEQVRELAQSTAPSPATGVRLRGGDAGPRYRRNTSAAPMANRRVPTLAVIGVLALAIIGALAYWQVPRSVQESRDQKFSTLLAAAREANARAQATGDAGLKRQLLSEARTKLTDAAKIRRDDADVASLQADVSSALTVLNAVYEVKDFTTVVDLAQQTTGTLSVNRVVVGGGNAFFIDTKGKRVLGVPLSGAQAPQTILEEGQPAFVTPGRPVLIAWSEATKSLTIVDDRRQVFAHVPGGGTIPLIVRGIDAIAAVDAATASAGNLYLLDIKDNQVWRYLPGQGGFDSERTGLLDAADLRNATEVAVGQDVYVLDAKQGIRRFVGKTEAPFPLAAIDTPLAAPASLSVLPGSNRVVVADRSNKRIVVASADGAFLRQIVSPAFTDLRAVAIDEGTGTMYVLNGERLLKGVFPP